MDIDGDGDEDVLITEEGTSTVPITKLYVNETPQVALSIENRQDISEDLIVYPNPTKTNKLFVEFTGHQTEIEWVIKIHDLFGRTVLKEQINNTTGQPIEIELPVLPVGQYFISIANGKQKATKGFVVE